jgi:prepilin signal peptidase PulO-like enzyme (type II secretory pathway)
MIAESIFLFVLRSATSVWFTAFFAKRLKLEISKLGIVFFAIILNCYTAEQGFIVLSIFLLLISELDRKELRIPDLFTKSSIFIFTILAGADFYLLAVAWGWIAFMYLVTFLFPEALGRGDVKLIGALVLLSKWMTQIPPHLVLAYLLVLASCLALPGAWWMRSRQRSYPFAPAISGATLLLF